MFFKLSNLNSNPALNKGYLNLALYKSALGFKIRNTDQGIRNLTNDWNPESKLP